MYSAKDKARITREVSALVLSRAAKMCNIVEYKEHKIVYKRCVAATGNNVAVVASCNALSTQRAADSHIPGSELLFLLPFACCRSLAAAGTRRSTL